MSIKVMLEPGAKMPTRAHETDAGLDLYAREYREVPAKGSAIFDTGVHLDIPAGFVGMIKSKSGLNVKHGLLSEGVVDATYSGSIVVKLYNHSEWPYAVHIGDKISQICIMPVATPTLELVDQIEESGRGNNGFGSSGR